MTDYKTVAIYLRVPVGDYCYRQGGPLCGHLTMSGGRAVCESGFTPRAEGAEVRKSPACASLKGRYE